MKKFPKIILFSILLSIFLVLPSNFVQADISKPNLQITIPNLTFSTAQPCADDPNKTCYPWIGEYIIAIYTYAIGIVGILATVVLMYGGMRWLTSGGSSDKIGDAKEWIKASLSGLVLVLASFMILNYVNPALIQPTPIAVKNVSEAPKVPSTPKITDARHDNCSWSYTSCTGNEQNESNTTFCGSKTNSSQSFCCCTITAPLVTENGACAWSNLMCNTGGLIPANSETDCGINTNNLNNCCCPAPPSTIDCSIATNQGKECKDEYVCNNKVCQTCLSEGGQCGGGMPCCEGLDCYDKSILTYARCYSTPPDSDWKKIGE